MENDIKVVMTNQWADVFTAYYIDAIRHFEKFGHENTSVGAVTEWTKDWLKLNVSFTNIEEKNVS